MQLSTTSSTLQNFEPLRLAESFLAEYREANILDRFQVILREMNQFFDHQQIDRSPIPDLTQWHILQLRAKRWLGKLNKLK